MNPQEGDIADLPDGRTAVYQGGRWVVQSGGQDGWQVQPMQSPSDQRADQRLSLAEETAARQARAEERRVENEGRTADRQGVQDEIGLATRFEALPEIREFPVVRGQYQIIRQMAADSSPAGDLALVTAYMKLLDPGSVVREQEFSNAQNAGGLEDRARAHLASITGNGILSPKQRADFVSKARGIYEVQATVYNARATEFRRRAEQYGFEPDNIAALVEIEAPEAEDGPITTQAQPGQAQPNLAIPERNTRGNAPEFDPSVPFGGQRVIRPGEVTEERGDRTDEQLRREGYVQSPEGWSRNLTPEQYEAMGYKWDGSQPDGGAWVLDYSEGYIDARNAARGEMNSQDTGLQERVRAVSSGMSYGLSDELERQVVEARTRGENLNNRLLGQNIPYTSQEFGQAYEDEADARQRRFAQDRPLQNLGLQIGGGIMAPGAMAGGRYIAQGRNTGQVAGRGAMVGGGAGAAYGFGNERGLENRISGAGTGAMTGAIAGAALSGGGRVVGQGVATRNTSAGAMTSPRAQQVQLLQNHGVSLTPGQRMGGLAKTAEDLAQRAPILGTAIKGARQRGVESMNRARGNVALDAINEGVPANVNVGGDMVGFVQGRLGEQFDKAYSMVPEINVNDPDLVAGLTRIRQATSDLPEAAARQFDNIVKDRLARLQGSASGEQVGGIRSELNTLAGRYLRSQDAGQQDLGRMIAELGDELDGAISRANPEAGKILTNARSGYADYIQLENASTRANGKPFSPGQFESAVKSTDGSVRHGSIGRGTARGQDFANAAREVMPDQFGNPGTADTLAAGGLLVNGLHAPITTGAIAGGLSAASVPYLMMGRKIVEKLPANASRKQLESVYGELDALAQQDSNVIVLRDAIARRIAQTVPAAAEQSTEVPRLMTGTRRQ